MQFGNPLNGIVTTTQTQFTAVKTTQPVGTASYSLGTGITYPAGTSLGNYHTCLVVLRTLSAPTGGTVTVFLLDSNLNEMWSQVIPASSFVAVNQFTVAVPLPLSFGDATNAVGPEVVHALTGLGANMNVTIILDQATNTPAVFLAGVGQDVVIPVSGTVSISGLVNLGQVVAAPAAAIPADAIFVGGGDNAGLLRAIAVAVAGNAAPPNVLIIGGTDGNNARAMFLDSAGRVAVLPESYPINSTPFAISSGNITNAVLTLTEAAVAAKRNFISGFDLTALGATAAKAVSVTLTGVQGGATLSWLFVFPLGVAVIAAPLNIRFDPPLQGAVNTAMTLSVPAGGAGNTNTQANMYGYTE